MERIKLTKDGKVDKRQFNGGHVAKGAGRPVGSVNKMPVGLRGKAAEAHMANGGLMPLDFMLAVLRGNMVEGGGEGKDHWKFGVSWDDKKWAADKLLHCFTPKLTNTTLKGTVQVLSIPPESLKDLTDEELAVMERALGKLAGEKSQLNGFSNGHTNGHATVSAAAYAEALGDED